MSNGFGRVGFGSLSAKGGNGLGQIVKIIKIPEALTNNAKTLRLEGQITSVNKQSNTARIQTSEGEFNVKVKSNDVSQGQRLIVDVPAGRPPKQVRLSPEAIIKTPDQPRESAPRSPAVTIDTRTAQSSQPPQAPTLTQKIVQKISQKLNGSTPPPTPNERTEGSQNTQQNQNVTNNSANTNTAKNTQNLPQDVAKQLLAQVAKNLPDLPQTLKPNDVVRILSATPSQAQGIATQTAQNLPAPTTTTIQPQIKSSLPNNGGQRLPLTAQNISTLLNGASLPNITLQNAVNATLNAPSAGAQTLLSTQSPVTQIISSTQTLNTVQTNAALQTIAPNLATSATTSTGSLSSTLQPVTFYPLNPANIAVTNTPKIDIQILKITPATPQLTTPNANISTAQAPQIIPAATQFTSPVLSNASATALVAKVTGFTPQGLPLITAKFPNASLPQSFIMQYKGNNLTVGTQLQITPKTTPSLIPLTVAPQPINPLLQGFQWPALDELYNSLLQISPQSAASLTRSLPNASNPTQMGAAAMLFISAVKTGDLNGFLGDKKIDLLQQAGKAKLLSSLTQGGDSARAATEGATSSEWRAVPLPMFWEGEIQRITLYTRNENQHNQNQDNENQNGQTRFVFDLSLTRMGKVQLDGFLKDQRLDLVIRTQNGFSPPMQQTMRQAYSGALEQTSLSGELNFQGSTENWVHVLENEKQFGANA